MSDNNNQNDQSSCAFAEQMIACLYGEAGDERETDLLNAHLKFCPTCAAEFASFGAVRSSILEWQIAEFSALETPVIENPVWKFGDFHNPEINFAASRRWSAKIRQLFLISPNLTASSAFAAIVICLGIAFFAFRFSNRTEVAKIENPKATEMNYPFAVGSEIVAADEKNSFETLPNEKIKSSTTILQSSARQKVKPVKFGAKNSNVKIIVDSGRAVKILNLPNSGDQKRNAASGDKKMPSLQAVKMPPLNNSEDEEDKSLRLAELFDDAEAK